MQAGINWPRTPLKMTVRQSEQLAQGHTKNVLAKIRTLM